MNYIVWIYSNHDLEKNCYSLTQIDKKICVLIAKTNKQIAQTDHFWVNFGIKKKSTQILKQHFISIFDN